MLQAGHLEVSAAAIVMRGLINDPILPIFSDASSLPVGVPALCTQSASLSTTILLSHYVYCELHCPPPWPLGSFSSWLASSIQQGFNLQGRVDPPGSVPTLSWSRAGAVLATVRSSTCGTPRMCSSTFAHVPFWFSFRSPHSIYQICILLLLVVPRNTHRPFQPVAHPDYSVCLYLLLRNLLASSTPDLMILHRPDHDPETRPTAPLETFNSGGIARIHREPRHSPEAQSASESARQPFLPCFGRPTACVIPSVKLGQRMYTLPPHSPW